MPNGAGQVIAALDTFIKDTHHEIDFLERAEEPTAAGLYVLKSVEGHPFGGVEDPRLRRVGPTSTESSAGPITRNCCGSTWCSPMRSSSSRKTSRRWQSICGCTTGRSMLPAGSAPFTSIAYFWTRRSCRWRGSCTDGAACLRLVSDLGLDAGLREESRQADSLRSSAAVPTEPTALLNLLAEDPAKSFAAWAEFSYALHRLGGAGGARPGGPDTLAGPRVAKLAAADQGPAQGTRSVADLLTKSGPPTWPTRRNARISARSWQRHQAKCGRGSAAEDHRVPEIVGDHYQHFMGIDVSTLARARSRSRRHGAGPAAD